MFASNVYWREDKKGETKENKNQDTRPKNQIKLKSKIQIV